MHSQLYIIQIHFKDNVIPKFYIRYLELIYKITLYLSL